MALVLGNYKSFIIENAKIVFGLGGTLLILLVVLLPSVLNIPQTYRDLGQQKKELQVVSQHLRNINDLVDLQQSLKSSLVLIDAALPSKEEVPNLMIQVQSIATESGITLKAVQFGGIAKVEGSAHKKITLQTVLEGSFASLSSLLKSLENSSRIIDVESLNFDSRKGEDNLSAAFGLSAYFLPEEGNKKNSGEVSPASLSSKTGLATLDYLKNLRIYEPQAVSTSVGKSNPFR